MRGWRGKTVVAFAANATNSVPHGKILISGAFAGLLMGVAGPVLFRADVPPAAANSTLKCYDSDENYQPCIVGASASPSRFSPSRFDGQATEARRPPSWTVAALYQQENWAAIAVDQPANWPTDAPAPKHASTPPKRSASAACARRLLPCIFSSLRKGLTHLASAAANGARAPGREHL